MSKAQNLKVKSTAYPWQGVQLHLKVGKNRVKAGQKSDQSVKLATLDRSTHRSGSKHPSFHRRNHRRSEVPEVAEERCWGSREKGGRFRCSLKYPVCVVVAASGEAETLRWHQKTVSRRVSSPIGKAISR